MSDELEKLTETITEWRKLLSEEAYAVLFKEATEPVGTSFLNQEKRKGTFISAACHLPMFESSEKYESGTRWPSFFRPTFGHLETKTDFKLIFQRTEYHCARCGGHQGYVFKDCPQPIGQRYCCRGVTEHIARRDLSG